MDEPKDDAPVYYCSCTTAEHKVKWNSDDNSGITSGPLHLTHCILVDSSTVICWTCPFVILEVSGLLCHFYSILDGKSCKQTL